MMMSILELLQHIVNKVMPRLMPEGRLLRAAQECVEACTYLLIMTNYMLDQSTFLVFTIIMMQCLSTGFIICGQAGGRIPPAACNLLISVYLFYVFFLLFPSLSPCFLFCLQTFGQVTINKYPCTT